MPNKNETRSYDWPKKCSPEEMFYKARIDEMPNGTILVCYDQKLLTSQVKSSLDKISDGKKKK